MAKASGSIFWREDRQRWMYEFVDEQGKVRSFSFKTKREAEDKRDEVRQQMNNGLSLPRKEITLAKYLQEEWLPEVWRNYKILGSTKFKTYEGYESDCRNHIIPRLGTVKMNRVTKTMVDDLVNARVANGDKKSSIKRMLKTLSNAYNRAIDNSAETVFTKIQWRRWTSNCRRCAAINLKG